MTRSDMQEMRTEAEPLAIKVTIFSDEMATLTRGTKRVWVHDDGQTYHVRGEKGYPYNTAFSVAEVMRHASRQLESDGSQQIWAI